jgi:hypothetical protein
LIDLFIYSFIHLAGFSAHLQRLRPLLNAALEAYGKSEDGLWLQLAQVCDPLPTPS